MIRSPAALAGSNLPTEGNERSSDEQQPEASASSSDLQQPEASASCSSDLQQPEASASSSDQQQPEARASSSSTSDVPIYFVPFSKRGQVSEVWQLMRPHVWPITSTSAIGLQQC